MPLYEYFCSGCNNQFEILVRAAGSLSQPACPDCGSREVRKLLSLVAARSNRGGTAPANQVDQPTTASYGGGCGCGSCGCH